VADKTLCLDALLDQEWPPLVAWLAAQVLDDVNFARSYPDGSYRMVNWQRSKLDMLIKVYDSWVTS
jgi:hypothetical protein